MRLKKKKKHEERQYVAPKNALPPNEYNIAHGTAKRPKEERPTAAGTVVSRYQKPGTETERVVQSPPGHDSAAQYRRAKGPYVNQSFDPDHPYTPQATQEGFQEQLDRAASAAASKRGARAYPEVTAKEKKPAVPPTETGAQPVEQPTVTTTGRVVQGEGSTAYIDPNNRITARKTVGELNTALVGQTPGRMDIGQSVFKQTGEKSWEGQGGFQGKVSPVATANPAAAVFQDVEDATREAAKKTFTAQTNQVNQAAQGIKGTVGGIKAGGTSGKWFQDMGKASKSKLPPGVVEYGHGVSGQTTLMQERDSFNRTPFAGNKNVQAVQEEMSTGVRGLTNEEKRAGVQGTVKTRYNKAIYGPEQQKAIETAGRGGKPEEYNPYNLTPQQKYYAERYSNRIDDAIKGNDWSEVWRIKGEIDKVGIPVGTLSPTAERYLNKMGRLVPGKLPEEVEVQQKKEEGEFAWNEKFRKAYDDRMADALDDYNFARENQDTNGIERAMQRAQRIAQEGGMELPEQFAQLEAGGGQMPWEAPGSPEAQKVAKETAEQQAKTQEESVKSFIAEGSATMKGAATPEQKEAAYYDIMKRGLDLGIPPNEMNNIEGFGAMYIAKRYGLDLQPEKKVTSAEQARHVQSAETFIFGKTEMVKQTVPDKTGKMVTQEVSQAHVNPAIQSINASEHAVSQSLGRDFALKCMFVSGDEKYPGLWDAWLRFRRVEEAQGVKPEEAARYWMMQLDMIGGDVREAWTANAPNTKGTWKTIDEDVQKSKTEARKADGINTAIDTLFGGTSSAQSPVQPVEAGQQMPAQQTVPGQAQVAPSAPTAIQTPVAAQPSLRTPTDPRYKQGKVVAMGDDYSMYKTGDGEQYLMNRQGDVFVAPKAIQGLGGVKGQLWVPHNTARQPNEQGAELIAENILVKPAKEQQKTLGLDQPGAETARAVGRAAKETVMYVAGGWAKDKPRNLSLYRETDKRTVFAKDDAGKVYVYHQPTNTWEPYEEARQRAAGSGKPTFNIPDRPQFIRELNMRMEPLKKEQAELPDGVPLRVWQDVKTKRRYAQAQDGQWYMKLGNKWEEYDVYPQPKGH